MTQCDARADAGTHEVYNQPPLRGDYNLWQEDAALRGMAAGLDLQADMLEPCGRVLGQADMREAARDANRNAPELRLFDSGGRRLDEVRFHPAWHRFMEISARAGYAAVAWEGGPGGHANHAAMVYLASQVEPGHCCPLTMSYAAVTVIAAQEHLAPEWRAGLLARQYDPSVRPVAAKQAVTLGMAMTEKQGGSDLSGSTTRAEPGDGMWLLTGHKWFCSAPMSDGFLTLAQTPRGLTCFLVPRWFAERTALLLTASGLIRQAPAAVGDSFAATRLSGERGRVAGAVQAPDADRILARLAPAGQDGT